MRIEKLTIRFAFMVFALLWMICAATMNARAQGVIIPRPCERCPHPFPLPHPVPLPRALPVKSIKLDTKIREQVATTHVEQIFRNDTNATLEGTYFFPIPETASITEFVIWDGERRLVGEVRSREEARRIYEDIVRRQRDPGLLEYAGKDLFQASVFPINPHSDKKLELTYTQILRAGKRHHRVSLSARHRTPTCIHRHNRRTHRNRRPRFFAQHLFAEPSDRHDAKRRKQRAYFF